MAGAQNKTQTGTYQQTLQGPDVSARSAIDALEEAGGWYFDDDEGRLKTFAMSLSPEPFTCTLARIAQTFSVLDLALYDATTCKLAVWLFDQTTPLSPQQKGQPTAPQKPKRRRTLRRRTVTRRLSPQTLWPLPGKCASPFL